MTVRDHGQPLASLVAHYGIGYRNEYLRAYSQLPEGATPAQDECRGEIAHRRALAVVRHDDPLGTYEQSALDFASDTEAGDRSIAWQARIYASLVIRDMAFDPYGNPVTQ